MARSSSDALTHVIIFDGFSSRPPPPFPVEGLSGHQQDWHHSSGCAQQPQPDSPPLLRGVSWHITQRRGLSSLREGVRVRKGKPPFSKGDSRPLGKGKWALAAGSSAVVRTVRRMQLLRCS